jgi:hypothetical protein
VSRCRDIAGRAQDAERGAPNWHVDFGGGRRVAVRDCRSDGVRRTHAGLASSSMRSRPPWQIGQPPHSAAPCRPVGFEPFACRSDGRCFGPPWGCGRRARSGDRSAAGRDRRRSSSVAGIALACSRTSSAQPGTERVGPEGDANGPRQLCVVVEAEGPRRRSSSAGVELLTRRITDPRAPTARRQVLMAPAGVYVPVVSPAAAGAGWSRRLDATRPALRWRRP